MQIRKSILTARVLIIGLGYLGQQLNAHLQQLGYHTSAIKRQYIESPHTNLIFKDILTLHDTDLIDVDFIVYCPSSNERTPSAYQKIYAHGIHIVSSIYAKRQHQPRLIYISSSRVFAPSYGHWVDEDSPVNTQDPLAVPLLDGEAIAHRSGLEAIVVRCSGIYGPSRHPILNALKQGNASLCHSPRFSNRIHVNDCARAIIHLMTLHQPHNLYIASDSMPTPNHTIATWLSEKIHIDLPPHIPSHNPPPINNKKLSNARLISCGFQFQYPSYQQGFTEILNAQR